MNPSKLSNIQQTQEQKTQQAESERKKLHALFDRSRFFRHAKNQAIPEVRLTERDQKILTTVHSYRFLDTDTLKRLTDPQTSDAKFRKRTRALWRKEYLHRLKEGLYLRVIGAETCLLWALGPRGYETLADIAPELELPTDNYQARRMKQKNDEIKASTLVHDLRLNKFRACIELGARNHDQVSLPFWNRYGVRIEVETKTISAYLLKLFPAWVLREDLVVIPDSYFALDILKERSQDNESKPTRRHFFVEYHHKSDCSPRWVYKKALGYAECWRQDLSSKERGFSRDDLTILLVAPTPARKDGIRRAIGKFLADAWRKGAKYPEDLWLCTDDSFCLNEPHTVFDPIWQTATSEEKFSLLD